MLLPLPLFVLVLLLVLVTVFDFLHRSSPDLIDQSNKISITNYEHEQEHEHEQLVEQTEQ